MAGDQRVISRAHLGQLARDQLVLRGVPVASPAEGDMPTTLTWAEALGRLLAKAHLAWDELDLPTGAQVWEVSWAMLGGLDDEWLERLLHDLPEERSLLRRWRRDAIEAVAEGADTDEGLCHGEVYPATCRVRNDGSLAISELDWIAPGRRIYDVATFRWVLAVQRPDNSEQLFGSFCDSYQAVRPLPSPTQLNAWVALRHLWSLRLAAGFENASSLRRRVDFARSWPVTPA